MLFRLCRGDDRFGQILAEIGSHHPAVVAIAYINMRPAEITLSYLYLIAMTQGCNEDSAGVWGIPAV